MPLLNFLSSTIVRHLEKVYAEDKRKVIAFWYIDRNDKQTQSVDLMIRCLIRQLTATRGAIPAAVQALITGCTMRGTRPDIDELLPVFHDSLESLGKDAFIIIDGLDQCHDDSGFRVRSSLADFIEQVIHHGHDNIHFALSSQETESLPNPLTWLPDQLKLIWVNMGEGTDVWIFTQSKLETEPGLKDVPGLLKDKIREYLDGRCVFNHLSCSTHAYKTRDSTSFLWASSKLKDLADCHSDAEDIEKILKQHSPTMDNLYEQSLRRVPGMYRPQLRSILCFLAICSRPMAVDLVADYVFLRSSDDISRICPSLLVRLETRSSGRLIQLSHFSVRAFLTSGNILRSADASFFHVDEEGTRIELANRSLDFLLEMRTSAFWPFATFHIWEEITRIAPSPAKHSIEEKIYQLLQPERTPAFILLSGRIPQEASTPLLFAMQNKLRDIVLRLITEHQQRCYAGSIDRVIQICFGRRDYEVLSRILEHDTSYHEPGMVLYEAAGSVDHPVFEKLLHSMPSSAVLYVDGTYGTALHHACLTGNLQATKLLVEFGADPNTKAGPFQTPLQAAAYNGHSEMAQLLLDHGSRVNDIGGYFGNALQAALYGKRKDITSILRSHGANIHCHSGVLWVKAQKEFVKGLLQEQKDRDYLVVSGTISHIPANRIFPLRWGTDLASPPGRLRYHRVLEEFRQLERTIRVLTEGEKTRWQEFRVQWNESSELIREMDLPEVIDYGSQHFNDRHVFRASVRQFVIVGSPASIARNLLI